MNCFNSGYQPTDKLDTSKPPKGKKMTDKKNTLTYQDLRDKSSLVGVLEEASVNEKGLHFKIMKNSEPSLDDLALRATDNVNHPKHYMQGESVCKNCGTHIECIDVTRHKNFNIGNAIKYIWRCDYKGNKVEDLKKAIWYLQDEIRRLG